LSDLKQLEWALDIDISEQQELKVLNFHGWEALQNEVQAIGPYFSNKLMERINHRKACNIIVVGEAGIWKTYCAMQLARQLYNKFCIDQVVYGYSTYYEVLMDKRFGIGAPIVLDEPQDAIDHRDWYKEAQQAIVKTITSQRFMVKPLIIPIINSSLIDKTIRNYLIQYQVECVDRGFARVMSLSPSQKEDKTYFSFLCNLRYGLMDKDKCAKPSCLFCDEFDTCQIFRAQYERKKQKTQFKKYEQNKQEAIMRESKELTLDQLFEICYPLRDSFTVDQHIDVRKLRLILREKTIHVGHNKAYDIKTLLEYRYPDDFKEDK